MLMAQGSYGNDRYAMKSRGTDDRYARTEQQLVLQITDAKFLVPRDEICACQDHNLHRRQMR